MSELSGNLVQTLGIHPRVSDSGFLGWRLKICISTRTCDLETHLEIGCSRTPGSVFLLLLCCQNLVIYPKKFKTPIQKDTHICIPIFVSALFTLTKIWKQLKHSSSDNCIKNTLYICTLDITSP